MIQPTADEPCSYCGKTAECRPYGKNAAKICVECAFKPENAEQTKMMMEQRFEKGDFNLGDQ